MQPADPLGHVTAEDGLIVVVENKTQNLAELSYVQSSNTSNELSSTNNNSEPGQTVKPKVRDRAGLI